MPIVSCHHCGSALPIARGFALSFVVENRLPAPTVPGPDDSSAIVGCGRCGKRLRILREDSPEFLAQLENLKFEPLPDAVPLAPESGPDDDPAGEEDPQRLTVDAGSDDQQPLVERPGMPVVPQGSAGAAVMFLSEAMPRDSASHSTFLGDVGWAFLFPSMPHNLVTFIILWQIVELSNLIWILPFVSFVGILLTMWYGAYLIQVLQYGTSGERDIGDINFVSDFWEDMVVPCFTWLISWGVALLPLAFYLAAERGTRAMLSELFWGLFKPGLFGYALKNLATDPMPMVFVFLAACIWPMTVLTLTLGGLNMVFRPLVILLSVLRTMQTYWFLVFLTLALIVVTFFINSLLINAVGGALGTGATWVAPLLRVIALTGVTIYLDLVLMRIVGVFYHHRKKGFAEEWG